MQPTQNNNSLEFEFYKKSIAFNALANALNIKLMHKQQLDILIEHIEEVKFEQLELFKKSYILNILPKLLELSKDCNLSAELAEYFNETIFSELRYQVTDAIHDYHYAKAKDLGLLE